VLYLGRVRWEGKDKMWWVPSKERWFGIKFFLKCHDL
jgi:hypothetical protein